MLSWVDAGTAGRGAGGAGTEMREERISISGSKTFVRMARGGILESGGAMGLQTSKKFSISTRNRNEVGMERGPLFLSKKIKNRLEKHN